MSAAISTLSKLGLSAASPVTVRYDFLSENLIMDEEIKDGNGLRGTRTRDISRTRSGLQRIGGGIVMQPNSVELSTLLPWIMGGTPTGSGTLTYPFGETVPAYCVTIDRILKVFTYAGVSVDQATFKCSQGELLTLELALVGSTETVGAAGTFPSGLTINNANGAWIAGDLVIVINSVTVTVKEFTMIINNGLDKDRFFNSLTLQNPPVARDRMVTMGFQLPYGDWSALYNAGAGGVTASTTFTNAGAVLTVSTSNLQFPRKSPQAAGRQEIMFPIEAHCMGSGDTAGSELTVTMNVGP